MTRPLRFGENDDTMLIVKGKEIGAHLTNGVQHAAGEHTIGIDVNTHLTTLASQRQRQARLDVRDRSTGDSQRRTRNLTRSGLR